MDFFDMNFSELFKEKHGEKMFNEVNNLIKKENIGEYSSDYIEKIFKIAFFSFFGLKDNEIKGIIQDIMKGEKINVIKIKSVHKNSINKIKGCLQDTMDK